MSAVSIKNSYDGKAERENFFSLVRQYQRNYAYTCQSNGEAHSFLGDDGVPNDEAIRFKSVSSLGYSLDVIKEKVSNSNKPNQYEFLVSFMGILGAAGVLPQHYIKASLERIKNGDYALTEFVGMFEHRLISLYYKAWGKYKLPVQYESASEQGEDNFSTALKGFSGFYKGKSLQLYYSGHYAKNNRPLSNLKSIIKELLNTHVSIKSIVGKWLPISLRDRCMSGIKGKNNQLGSGVMLGKRYWDIQSSIIIRIGDITMKEFLALSPESPLYQLLVFTVNTYVPVHINVTFEFSIDGYQQEMKPIGQGYQLSRDAWLMSKSKDILISKRSLLRK